MIRPVEMIADYWVLIDDETEIEYKNKKGNNLVFETETDAQEFINALS